MRIISAGFLFILIILATYLVFRAPLTLQGDGLEYVIQTQSIAFDRKIAIDTEARREYWNETSPFSVKLEAAKPPVFSLEQEAQSGGGFGGLYSDSEGNYRYYHFWLYSLSVAPLYLLLHLFGGSQLAYHSFQIFNFVALLLPFLIAYKHSRSFWIPLLFLSTVFTPLFAYVNWQHPEVWLFSLIVIAFYMNDISNYRWTAPLLLGLAAAQNLPIIFFFPALYIFNYHRDSSAKRTISFLIGILIGLSSVFYYFFHFNTPSVIQAIGQADLQFASLKRVLSLYFSPMLGAFWYLSPFFLLIPLTRNSQRTLFLMLLGVGAVWLSSGTVNINSGHIGSSRYMIWIIAPLAYLLLFQIEPIRKKDIKFLLIALLIQVGITLHLELWRIPVGRAHTLHDIHRARPEVGVLYNSLPFIDQPEILVEAIREDELQSPQSFNAIYIWNTGEKRSIWIISKRALRRLKTFQWKGYFLPEYTSYPKNLLFTRKGDLRFLEPKFLKKFREERALGSYIIAYVDEAVRKEDISSNIEIFLRDGTTSYRIE